MAQKSMTKPIKSHAGKLITSLLLTSILIVGSVFPVSAVTEAADETAASSQLLSFWTNLVDWLSGSVESAVSAYYSPDAGLTLLGVLAVSFLALAFIGGIILWILKLCHFGR